MTDTADLIRRPNRRLDRYVSAETRFWSRVTKTPGCWRWSGANVKGRGQLAVNGRTVLAPRFSWELHRGPIPDGLFVCHHCDNPACVNPDHLFLGTNSDNQQDSLRKGRKHICKAFPSKKRARGEAHGSAKLTADDVREIRALAAAGQSKHAIARQFGVHNTNIGLIVRRKNWKHVK